MINNIIRKYRDDDFENVLTLFRLNVPIAFAPEEEDDLKIYLKNNSENYFLVILNQQIIGCGGYNVFEPEQEVRISWDFFHPNSIGKGYGTALLNYRINKIQKSFPNYSIIVRTSQFAFKFYEKQGFKVIRTEKDYWAKGYDLVFMQFNHLGSKIT